ncbi:hypothetical protein F2P56_027895, partial [Juglans regia]
HKAETKKEIQLLASLHKFHIKLPQTERNTVELRVRKEAVGIDLSYIYIYLQKNSWTDACHESTSISITKIPARPQDELPILRTQEGSGEGIIEALAPPPCADADEVVLIAIISPARTIGRTKPELHFVS